MSEPSANDGASPGPQPPQGYETPIQTWALALGFFALIVIVFGGFMVKFIYDDRVVSRWPTTEGTLTGGNATVWRGAEAGANTGLKLKFDYQVDGKKYTAYRYSPKMDAVPGVSEEEAVKRFTVGVKKPIIYNPTDHSEAYWEKNDFDETNIWKAWAIVAVGVVLLLISIVLIRVFGRKTSRTSGGKAGGTQLGPRRIEGV